MIVITFGQIGAAIFVLTTLIIIGKLCYDIGRGTRDVHGPRDRYDAGYTDPEATQRYLDEGRDRRYGPQPNKKDDVLNTLDEHNW